MWRTSFQIWQIGSGHFRMTTATIWLLAPHVTEAEISPWIRTRSGSFVNFHAIRYTSEINVCRCFGRCRDDLSGEPLV